MTNAIILGDVYLGEIMLNVINNETIVQVADIRTEYSVNKTAMLKPAHKYNVSKRTIFNIIHELIYK